MKSQGTINTSMVLAAGYGTRMRDLTDDTPKAMLPLNDHRIIDIILLKLAAQNIQRAVINLHHLGEQIEKYVGNGERYGLEVCYSREEVLMDTGGGVAFAERFFKGETILAVNGDVLSDISIRDMYAHHQEKDALATMAVLPSKNNNDYSLVLYDDRNRLTGFLGKGQPIPKSCHSGIFTGYQILTPDARSYLKPQVQSIITGFYLPALEQGEDIRVFPFKGHWVDLGTKKQYLAFRKDIELKNINLEWFTK